MKTIIFIGTNKSGSSREAIKAAVNMGYLTVLFTNNEKQIQQRDAYPDVHKMIFVDTLNIGAMKKEIHQLRATGFEIQTIVSFVDPFVHIASVLCDEFCQNVSFSKAIEIMEDKEATRNFLINQPYSPKFHILKPNDAVSHDIPYPVIVKSPKSTGSKDVLTATTEKQLKKQLAILQKKYPDETIIIEEFIEGPQYLVEVMIYKEKSHIIGIMEQEITSGKRFIITGYGMLLNPPKHLETGILEVVQSIIKTFEVKNGTMHLELRLTKNGWKLIEINPRISGGAMNKMIQSALGFSLVEETLKLFLGEQPNITPRHRKFVYTKYVIVHNKGILQKVTGKGRALKSPGVVEVYIKPKKGTLLIPPLSMGHRYAYVIAEGSTLEKAKQNALNASKEIQFHLLSE